MNSVRRQIGCLSVVFALLPASCGKREPALRPDAAPREVRVARAELRPMERVLNVVGTLSAHEETTVAAQVAGQIENYAVDLGSPVTAGQELALIDTAAYEALARQSAANVARAVASAENAVQNLKRAQELQKDKIASASELELAIATSDQASAEVKAAEAADSIARLNLERSRVKAPFAGAVAERISSVGGYVVAGTPIIRLVQTDPLRLRVEVPEREAPSVRTGQTVRVTVEGDPKIYLGQLARVSPSIRESSRMLQAEADVPAQGSLRPGQFARAQIIISEDDQVVSVPVQCIVTFAGLEKVIAVQDGKAVEKVVATGRRHSDWVEIVSGLAAGETVILNPAGLRMGQPVIIRATVPDSQAKTTVSQNGP
jgi:RND family efflux transporter MFP subunit